MVTGISPRIEQAAAEEFDLPLVKVLQDLRLEQINNSQATEDNSDRLDKLHNAVSALTYKLGVPAGEIKLGDSSRGAKRARLETLPESDGIFSRIKEAVSGLGQKLLSLFSKNDTENRKEELAGYLSAIDSASKAEGSSESFNDFFFDNLDNLEIGDVDREDFDLLVELALEDALKSDPELDLTKEPTMNFIRRVATLMTDKIFKNINIDIKLPSFQESNKAIEQYLRVGDDNNSFTASLRASDEAFTEAVPMMVYQTLLYSRANMNEEQDFNETVVKNFIGLREYYDEIGVEPSRAMVTVKPKNHPEFKNPPALAEWMVDLDELIDLPYEENSKEAELFDQIDQFNAEFSDESDRFLSKYLRNRSDYREMVKTRAADLSIITMNSLVGENIHGALNLKRDKSSGKSEKGSSPGRDVIHNQGSNAFEGTFAKVASRVYSILTNESIPFRRALKLTKFSFSESAADRKFLDPMRANTEKLIKDPENKEVRREFDAKKAEAIFLYLMDIMSLDNKGVIGRFDMQEVASFVKAVK